MNSGQTWTIANQQAAPRQEYLAQLEQFTSAQHALEQSASAFFNQLRSTAVPAAIKQAIEIGRTTVGFYAASWHLNTTAFMTFRQWLQEEGLACMCAQLTADQREQPDLDVVINVFPRAA